ARRDRLRKELMGAAIGLGVFAGSVAAGIPVAFAAAAGAIGYAGGWLLLPRKKRPDEIFLEANVTQARLDAYVSRLPHCDDELLGLATGLAEREVREHVDALRDITQKIVEAVRRDPRDVDVAPELPLYLEKIVETIARYAQLIGAAQDAGAPDARL